MKVSYDEAIKTLQMKLRDYMESQSIKISASRSFSCINKSAHKHGDRTPSGWLYEEGNYPNWRCMTCGESGDVFNIASLMHGFPLSGKGFILETIPHVAEKVGLFIEIDNQQELEENIKISLETKKLLKQNHMDHTKLMDGTYGKTRKYTEEIAKELVETFDLAYLKEPVFDNPLLHPTTYPGHLPILIPIVKEGILLGTIGRHSESACESGVPKYHNSLKTEAYSYPSILNYDRGLTAAKKARRVYIFEGVFNTLMAYISGISNSIGILGVNSRITDLELFMQESGAKEIVFCLDKDLQGADKAIELGKKFQSLGYISLYYKYKNPDKDYDIEFNDDPNFAEEITGESNIITLIDYLLYSKADYLSKTNISNTSKFELIMKDISAYGSIVNGKNYAISIVEYYKSIGDNTISIEDILPRIKQSLTDKNSPLITRLDELSSTLLSKVITANTVEEKLSIIDTLHTTSKKATENITSGIKISGKRDLERILNEQNEIGLRRYKTGYENLDFPIDDNHKIEFSQENLVGLLGKPSHAKSVLLRGFAMYQAFNNPDVMVFYFSTDDSARRTIAWMLAGLSRIPFTEIMKSEKERDRAAMEHIREAQTKLRKIYGENLIVYDKEQAFDTNGIIRILNDAYREFPNKRFIAIVDNLYNQNDIQSGSEVSKRESLDDAIERYKYLTTSRVDVFINSLEVKKNTIGRLGEKDIKETGSIDYRNDVTMAMFNSFREFKQDSRMYTHIGTTFTPIIELHMLKRKTGEVGYTHYFLLDGPCGLLTPVTDPEQISQFSALMKADRGIEQREPKSSGVGTFSKPGEFL
jgi:DNA primase